MSTNILAPSLSIVYPYYNNVESLNRQVEKWRTYPIDIARQVQIIIVDDFSENPPIIPEDIELNFLIARVTSDIWWNQPGARNLGFKLARSNWVFTSDIDHVLGVEQCSSLLNYAKKSKTVYYFGRIDENNGAKLSSHPNTYLIERANYWNLGGYDEDFCGHYGYDDLLFSHIIKATCESQELSDINLLVRSTAAYDGLERNGRFNKHLYKKKSSRFDKKKYRNSSVLRFEWEIVSERLVIT